VSVVAYLTTTMSSTFYTPLRGARCSAFPPSIFFDRSKGTFSFDFAITLVCYAC